MPENSVDLIFADPPYNLSNNGITCRSGKMASVNKGEWDKSQGLETDFIFHRQWIAACRRVLKPEGTIWISGTYHSIYACGYALQLEGFHLLNDIIWFKPNAAPNLSCRMFTASHETLLWARKDGGAKHVFNYEQMKEGDFAEDIFKRDGKQMRSVWSIPVPGKYERAGSGHPTQKPLALLGRIIEACTEPNAFILDPFMGSGTTGVAALKSGRRFLGIENNIEYYDFAKARMQQQHT